MPTQPAQAVPFDSSLLAQLACPVCLGSLKLAPPRLVCASCGRAYPIVDEIPVLIADRAETPQNR